MEDRDTCPAPAPNWERTDPGERLLPGVGDLVEFEVDWRHTDEVYFDHREVFRGMFLGRMAGRYTPRDWVFLLPDGPYTFSDQSVTVWRVLARGEP